MASIGFYDIRTFECLNREMENKCFGYNSIYDGENNGPHSQVLHEHHNNLSKKENLKKRKQKQMDKMMAPVSH